MKLALLIMLAVMPMLAQDQSSPSPEPITTSTADIIRLVQAGTPDAEILQLIQSTMPQYNLINEWLAKMEKAHVSDTVIRAMAARNRTPAPPPDAKSDFRYGVNFEEEPGPKGSDWLRLIFGVADAYLSAPRVTIVAPRRGGLRGKSAVRQKRAVKQ